MLTAEFLALVIPDGGLRCIALLPPEVKGQPRPAMRHFWYDTNEGAAAALMRMDPDVQPGWSLYYAPASFSADKRSVTNVQAIQSLWLDLDCGSGKPHLTPDHAEAKLVAWCREEGLPVPLRVRSGGGLHVYWLFDRPLDRDEWRQIVDGFRAVAVEVLGADPTPLHPAAVLRPVGTHHRKRDPVLVEAGEVPERISPAVFDRFKGAAPTRSSRSVTLMAEAKGLHLNARILRSISDDGPEYVDFDRLRTRCLQFRDFATPGNTISQSVWFLNLRALAATVGGAVPAVRWSNHWGGDAEQNAGDAEAEFERAGDYPPPRCKDYGSGGACASCLYAGHVGSPLEASWARPRGNDELAEAAASSGAGSDVPDGRGSGHDGAEPAGSDDAFFDTPDKADGSLIWHPRGFQNQNGALLLAVPREGKKDEPVVFDHVKIATPEVRMIGVAAFERSVGMVYNLERRHPKTGEWILLDLQAGQVTGTALEPYMAERGIRIHRPVDFKRWTRECIDYQETVKGTMTAYENYGWKHDFAGFVYGDRMYRDGRLEHATLDHRLRTRTKFLQPKPTARIEGWTRAARELVFKPGFEAVAFATLASLSAPLMKMQHRFDGGTIVSLVSYESATGKSTSLAGATSIWATEPRGLNKKGHDTKVSSGVIMGQLGNLPIIHDELYNKDTEVLHDEIQLFQSGEDRNRGTVDGGIKAQENTWQSILISASNQSLVGAVEARSGSDAMAYRVVELSVKSYQSEMTVATIERLTQELFDNGGLIGHGFLMYLTRPEILAFCRRPENIERVRAQWEAMGFRKEHRFWTRLLTCMAFTVRILKDMRALPEVNWDNILLWGVKQMQTNMDGLATTRPEDTYIELLVRFLNAHSGRQTYEAERAYRNGDGRVTPRQTVENPVVRRNLDNKEVQIDRVALRAWLQKHHTLQIKPFLQGLQEKGVLLSGNAKKNLMAGTPQSSGQIECVVINGAHTLMDGPALTLVPKETTNEHLRRKP